MRFSRFSLFLRTKTAKNSGGTAGVLLFSVFAEEPASQDFCG
jgi:hypothetical protein